MTLLPCTHRAGFLLFTSFLLAACSSDDGAGAETHDDDATDETDDSGEEETGSSSTSSSGGEGESEGTGGDDGSTASCPVESGVGEFLIQLRPTYTGISGRVADGVVPGNVPELVRTLEQCELSRPRNLICDPACTSSTTCGEGGTCVPYPVEHDVGTVTLLGMKDSPIEMTARAPAFNYTNPSPLQHPGFDEGVTIQLEATGGDYAAFNFQAFGVAALTGTPEKITVERDMPAVVTWAPPGQTGISSVHVELAVNLHGALGYTIRCDTEDDGSFEVPASLVTDLIDAGLSGFPKLVLTRQSVGSKTLEPGCVQLRVASDVTIEVEVPGLISCSNDDDCPDGQTCQPDLTCG